MTAPNTPPDLSSAAARDAYRRELAGVGRPIRWLGTALAVAGAALAGVRAVAWPDVPIVLPLVLIAAGALNLIAGTALRLKYHQARIKP